ncbi:MAG: AraC family transcriptional regulator [Myxococcales bacterium]|nr:AraC family transcriptional regulator [Myxococcales bacterium]
MPLTPHFHDEYVICVQLRGHEVCDVAGKRYEFDAGELVLINPHQVHTGNNRGSDDIEYVSLYVERDFVRAIAREHTGEDREPEFIFIHVAGQRELAHHVRELLARSREVAALPRAARAREDDALELDAAVTDVVARALTHFSNLNDPRLRSTNRVAHRAVARVVHFLHDREHDERAELEDDAATLEALATIAGLSKFHFLRQFSRVVGMTPGAYLRTLRMCRAARLLRTTGQPIAEVARATGFTDHASFSRAFRRHAGLSPRQYRSATATRTRRG